MIAATDLHKIVPVERFKDSLQDVNGDFVAWPHTSLLPYSPADLLGANCVPLARATPLPAILDLPWRERDECAYPTTLPSDTLENPGSQ